MIHLKKLWANNTINSILILMVCINISCTIQNNKYSLKSRLLKENGNYFYISSTYIDREVIWSYTSEDIIVYTLNSKGKILKIKKEKSNNLHITNHIIIDKEELNRCIELDGDYLGYKIFSQKRKNEEEYGINIKCFLQNNYHSEFYTIIKDDMIRHNIILYR